MGGVFSKVNGIARNRLVKLDAATGAVDQDFNANFSGGTVWDLKVWYGPNGSTPMLVVGRSIGKKLIALGSVTGKSTGYFDLGIDDPIPNAWGGVAIYKLAINPAGSQWLDNPNGLASQDGGGAARRLGLDAINPTTGDLCSGIRRRPPRPVASGSDLTASASTMNSTEASPSRRCLDQAAGRKQARQPAVFRPPVAAVIGRAPHIPVTGWTGLNALVQTSAVGPRSAPRSAMVSLGLVATSSDPECNTRSILLVPICR